MNIQKNKIKQDIFLKNFDSIVEFRSDWIGTGSNRVWSSFKNNKENNISYFDEDGYLITNDIGDKKVIDSEISWLYKINKNGFRSNHFEEIDSGKLSILTGGCSQSVGEGLPDNSRWQHFLLEGLDKNTLQHFDISSTGASCSLIINNVISFIRNYGSPKYIFLVFPDNARDLKFDEENNRFQNVNVDEFFLIKKDKSPKVFYEYTLNFNEYDSVMSTIKSIFALEELCRYANINLYWTTWFHPLSLIAKKIDFKNYVDIDWDYFGTLKTIPNPDNIKYWNFANDGLHFGVSWTSYQGKVFKEFINDKK